MDKKSKASYHEKQAEKKRSWAEGNWSKGRKLRKEANHHEEKAKSLRKKAKKNDSNNGGTKTKSLTGEEREKLKEKREKQWERQKRSALSRAIENISVDLSEDLPRTTEMLDGYPNDPITSKEDGIFYFSEMLLREEVERLIREYRSSDKRKSLWEEEHKKEMKRQSYLGHENHTYRSTRPIYNEDFKRLREHPKRVKEIVSDYIQAIKDNVERALEEEFRRQLFENFDFTTIHGVGPETAEELEEVAERVEGTQVGKGSLSLEKLDGKFEHLIEYLKLNDRTGNYKIWERIHGVGPVTFKRMEEIKEEIDEEAKRYVENYKEESS